VGQQLVERGPVTVLERRQQLLDLRLFAIHDTTSADAAPGHHRFPPAACDERLCRVVECRFFAGLTAEETAAALGVTVRTVERDWVKAKALLYEDLGS
jgi:hypothetical protein